MHGAKQVTAAASATGEEANPLVVEVGATVHVRDAGSGELRFWIVVSTPSDPSAGKISVDTPVAKALLGHGVGDVVTVATGSRRRYVIDRIDASPQMPAASNISASESDGGEIALFGQGQDAEYEDWVRRNRGGYVLKQRDRLEDGYMLHLAVCGHLALTAGTFTMRTGNPRRCSRSRKALEHWCAAETGSQPQKCSTCF